MCLTGLTLLAAGLSAQTDASGVVGYGTEAQRPATCVQGQSYSAIDNGAGYLCNAGVWVRVSQGQVSVMSYGAKGDGVTDDTAAIQAAKNAVCPGGGTVYYPPGRYLISSTLVDKCEGIVSQGPGPGGGKNRLKTAAATLVAAAGFTGPVYRIDPADVTIYDEFVRGSCVRDIQFDLTNAPTIEALRLNSVSNAPTFANVTISEGASTMLHIDRSSVTNAQISEGIQFYNLNVYAADRVNFSKTSPAVVISAANEVEFRDGKILAGYAPDLNVGTTGVLVRDGGNGQGTYGVTFDGVSTASFYVHYLVQTMADTVYYVPRDVRWLDCTFESYNVGVKITSAVSATFPESEHFLSGNRFSGSIGANAVGILLDKEAGADIGALENSFYSNDRNPPGIGLQMTANSLHNIAIGVPDGEYSDAGTGNVTVSYGANGTIDSLNGMRLGDGAQTSPNLTINSSSGGNAAIVFEKAGAMKGQITTSEAYCGGGMIFQEAGYNATACGPQWNFPQLSVGGGARFLKSIAGSASWTPGTLNNGQFATEDIMIAGVLQGDAVWCGFSTPMPAGWVLTSSAPAASTVRVSVLNETGGQASLPEGTVKCADLQF